MAKDNGDMPPIPPVSIIRIDALAFQDAGGEWIAQCIQYDIVARAPSLPELPKAIEREVIANLCINAKLGRRDLDGIPPAPQKYADEFREATLGLSAESKMKMLSGAKPVQLHELKVAQAVC